eukprot:g16620.t1
MSIKGKDSGAPGAAETLLDTLATPEMIMQFDRFDLLTFTERWVRQAKWALNNKNDPSTALVVARSTLFALQTYVKREEVRLGNKTLGENKNTKNNDNDAAHPDEEAQSSQGEVHGPESKKSSRERTGFDSDSDSSDSDAVHIGDEQGERIPALGRGVLSASTYTTVAAPPDQNDNTPATPGEGGFDAGPDGANVPETLGDWFATGPEIFATNDTPIETIVATAKVILEDTGRALNTIYTESINHSTVPITAEHPIEHLCEQLQANVLPLLKNPKKVKDVWRAEQATATIAQCCCLLTRFASDQGEKLATKARGARRFAKLLENSGCNFTRLVRQMLVLVWRYGIAKNNKGGRVHPMVLTLFSGKHYIKYPRTIQLCLLWLRCKIITLLPHDFLNRHNTIRILATTDLFTKHLQPQVEALFDLYPVTSAELDQLALERENEKWAWKDDGSQQSIEQWTTNLWVFDVVQNAYKYYPINYSDEIKKQQDQKNACIKQTGATNMQELNAERDERQVPPQRINATAQHHSLAATRGLSQMRMCGGVAAPPASHEHEDHQHDDEGETEEEYLEQRRHRMQERQRKRDLWEEEQRQLDEFEEDERRYKEAQHRFATRHPDGGRQFVQSAMSIECSYAQPITNVDPRHIIADPTAEFLRRRKGKEEEAKAEDFKKWECYFEAATTNSHRLPLTTFNRVPREAWSTVTTVMADKVRVINPMLYRELHHAISDYFNKRMREKENTGDFYCPPAEHEFLYATALRSTVQWLEEQFEQDEGEMGIERLAIGAQNGYYKKKPFNKAVDKYVVEDKVTFDKNGTYYPLGCLEKQDVADAYEDNVKRAVVNEGNLHNTMKIKDRLTYSSLRIGTDKMIKDVRPWSSKNHMDPQQAPEKNAKALADKFSVPNVLTMLIVQNGFYDGPTERLMLRLQDLTQRWENGAATPGSDGQFIARRKKRHLPKLYLKFADQLAQTEDKNMNIEDLVALLGVWMDSVPKLPKQAQRQPQQQPLLDQPRAPQNPKNPKNPKGGNNANKGGGKNQQQQTWDGAWDQWSAQHAYQQWANNQGWNPYGGGQPRGGGNGGYRGGGYATLGDIPPVDDINKPKRPQGGTDDVVPAPDAKLRKKNNGDREQSPQVQKYREAISKKCGCPTQKMSETPKLCIMAALSTLRKVSLDHLRSLQEEEKFQEQVRLETERLQAIVKEWRDKRDAMHSNWDDYEYSGARISKNWHSMLPPHERKKFPEGLVDHPDLISRSYVGYDAEYETRKLSPCFINMIADHMGFLSPTVREAVYGPEGYLNLGYDVEGPLPLYGAWPDARPLTKKEKERLRDTEIELEARKAHVDLMSKLRKTPYAFEDGVTTKGCYKAVAELFRGPHAKKVAKGDIPPKTWVWPFFGLGQRKDPVTGQWRKVRPIANEKFRNAQMSPLAEHMTLPGTATLVDMIQYCANPTIAETLLQTKDDVTESIIKNRKEKGGPNMTWQDTSRLPKHLPQYQGLSFVPCFGKLDLYQAYQQLAVRKFLIAAKN